jgi:putative heme-binding domain-containing protein
MIKIKAVRPIFVFPFSFCMMILLLGNCSNPGNTPAAGAGSNFLDTTHAVYGPYRVYKLPVTKGVTILNPVQLSLGPGGKLYAANHTGEVYTLNDSDSDGFEDEAVLFCNISDYGLKSPAGFASKGDTVFIGTSQEIRAFIDKDGDFKADTSWTIFKDIPNSQHPYEYTSAFAIGPDGWLYFALATDSWNAGASPDPHAYRGSILRISTDGKVVEKIATGIRSVYGMRFNNRGDAFFIDNEGGGNPTEELNLLVKGKFYGHNPKKFPGADSAVELPVTNLEMETAPSAIVFNTGGKSFGKTSDNLFVSYYGPGERWTKGAISRLEITPGEKKGYKFREHPVADIPKLSGIAFGSDGSLYVAQHGVSDYWYNSTQPQSGGFYKLVYDPSLEGLEVKRAKLNTGELSASSIEAGKQLFAEQACLACHSTDGKKELLGPSLNNLGNVMSRKEILENINDPSAIIKPAMNAVRILKKNGQVLLGRTVNTDESKVDIMLIGNKVVSVPKNEIQSITEEKKSLMYEGLLKGLDSTQINNLLDYLVSLK